MMNGLIAKRAILSFSKQPLFPCIWSAKATTINIHSLVNSLSMLEQKSFCQSAAETTYLIFYLNKYLTSWSSKILKNNNNNNNNNNNLVNTIYESSRKLKMKVTTLILDHIFFYIFILFYIIIIFNLNLWVEEFVEF